MEAIDVEQEAVEPSLVDKNPLVLQLYGVSVHQRDIEKLQNDDEWLTDNIIMLALHHFRHESPAAADFFIVDCMLFPRPEQVKIIITVSLYVVTC